MEAKKAKYKSHSEIAGLKISMDIYHPEGYAKTTDPLHSSDRCDMDLEFSHYGKGLSLHYHNEGLYKIFERINDAEKGIEALLGLKMDRFDGQYLWEEDRKLIRCLLALEDKLRKKLRENDPPLILDGDSGAS